MPEQCMCYIPFDNSNAGGRVVSEWYNQNLPIEGKPPLLRGKPWAHSGRHGMMLAEATTNLKSLGDFSDGSLGSLTAGGNNSLEIATELALFGNYSAKVEYQNSNELCTDSLTLSGNITYHVSCYIWVPPTWDSNDTIRIEPDTSAFNGYYSVKSNWAGNAPEMYGTWHRLVTEVTTQDLVGSPVAAYFKLQTYSGPTPGRFLYLDGIQLEEKAYATPFDVTNKDGITPRKTQHLRIPTAGNFPGPGGGSISINLRPCWNNNTTGKDRVLFSMEDSLTDSWLIFYDNMNEQFVFRMQSGDNFTDIRSPTQTISTGELVTLITTWNGTEGQLYVNGLEAKTDSRIQCSIRTPSTIVLGDRQAELGSWTANASFNEVGIFNFPLTHRQVLDINHIAEAGYLLSNHGNIARDPKYHPTITDPESGMIFIGTDYNINGTNVAY